MQTAERAEEVAALRRGEGDARVAEQQREHRPERRPEHEQREDRRDGATVDLLHENGDDEARLRMCGRGHELSPRHHADDRQVDAKVDHGNGGGADQDRPRNDASRLAHLVADVADVVVAENPDARRGAEAEKEA